MKWDAVVFYVQTIIICHNIPMIKSDKLEKNLVSF